ncbi:hypothetical protein BD770DRAFT_399300 [Pilaira anomala]|nr:hypothetical protein BD770DRAFT_399300 [Pilaira anomala]
MLMDCYATVDETKTLESFGEVPFVALINNKCLKTASESFYVQDKEASARESEVNQPTNNSNMVTDRTTVPSRILKDAFHVMQMIKISLKHGMAKDFMRRFRDALFVVDPDDKKKVEEYLVSMGIDWNTKLLSDPEYVFKRVKIYIPPAEELYPLVDELFKSYGDSICIKTGRPLFDEDARKDAAAVLEEIRLGHVSDLKGGPPLYTEIGTDRNGLTMYRCARGTSSVEGSVHMNIVGSKNRFGKIHKGHYSPWLSLSINTLKMKIGHTPVDNYFCNRVGNAFEFEQTKETFGIVSLPISVMREFDIEPAESTVEPTESYFEIKNLLQISTLPSANLPIMGYSVGDYLYKYLAQCQKTKLAVTAVHTNEEVALYQTLITDPVHKALIKFRGQAQKPDFVEFAKLWSRFCKDQSKIYYKTSRHLESYFNVMEDRKKYRDSVMLNIQKIQRIKDLTQNESRIESAGTIQCLPRPTPQNLSYASTIREEERIENPGPSRNTFVALAPLPPVLTMSPNIYRIRYIAPAHSLEIQSPNYSGKQKKKKKTCFLCKSDSCGGRSKRIYCVNKCGSCEIDTCPGKYDPTNRNHATFPCTNVLNSRL